MKINFSKYQGTGNDFVMIDNRQGVYNDLSIDHIQHLCDRRFGIGADGLIKINASSKADFEVDYYNSDGSKSFCGNGARCAVAFSEQIGIDVRNTTFDAIDGLHQAIKTDAIIALAMIDVESILLVDSAYTQYPDVTLYTGSPHYIRFVNSLDNYDIVQVGKAIRYSEPFIADGINVNAVQVEGEKKLTVYTYERGVEDETLSCGTGVTAAVLAYAYHTNLLGEHQVEVRVKGGELAVKFNQSFKGKFSSIALIGPGTFVFQGEIEL